MRMIFYFLENIDSFDNYKESRIFSMASIVLITPVTFSFRTSNFTGKADPECFEAEGLLVLLTTR